MKSDYTVELKNHYFSSDKKDIERWAISGAEALEYLPSEDNRFTLDFFGSRCVDCGQNIVFEVDKNTKRIWVVNESCSQPNGIDVIEFELNVPSGRMVFANDLRSWFPVANRYNINEPHGLLKTSQTYAEAGMAHAFVGNSTPDIYQITNTNLFIGYKSKKIRAKKLGDICTDLWWYSVADFETLKQRFSAITPNLDFNKYINTRCHLATVKPGVYKFKHSMHAVYKRYDGNFRGAFAEISWVREPDTTEKDIETFSDKNFTAGQVIIESLISHPSLYFKRESATIAKQNITDDPIVNNLLYEVASLRVSGKEDPNSPIAVIERQTTDQDKYNYILNRLPKNKLEAACQRVADNILCVSGTGIDWHENGWGCDGSLSPNTPDLTIPLFDKRYSWMFSPFSPLCYLVGTAEDEWGLRDTPKHFNESFQYLAFNMLYSIIKYGIEPFDTDAKTVERAKQTETFAKEVLQKLVAKYPDNVPDFVKPLLDAGTCGVGVVD